MDSALVAGAAMTLWGLLVPRWHDDSHTMDTFTRGATYAAAVTLGLAVFVSHRAGGSSTPVLVGAGTLAALGLAHAHALRTT